MNPDQTRRRLVDFILVLWNVAVLVGLFYLLIADMGWTSKVLALMVLPVVGLSGYAAFKKFIRPPPSS